jgi:hypothetical protein
MTSISKKLPRQLWGSENFVLDPSNPDYPDEQLLQDFIDNCEKVIPVNMMNVADDQLEYFDKSITNYLQSLKNEFTRSEKHE